MTKQKETPQNANWKKYLNKDNALNIIAVLILIGIVIFAVYKNFPQKSITEDAANTSVTPTPQVTFTLPQGWKEQSVTSENTILKIEKEVKEGIKPTILVMKTETKEEDKAAYVDKLIRGAQSTIPSLYFTYNTSSEKDGYYIRELSGTYSNAEKVVGIKQRIIVKDGVVYTLTGSYPQNDMVASEEISKLFDSIYESKVR